LEAALSNIAAEPIRVRCAGRTDAGVHATNQIVSFTTNAMRDSKAWVQGTNAGLPDDIAVTCAVATPESFNARFSANSRRYLYVIFNSPVRSGLMPEYVTREHRQLNHEKMHIAAQALLGKHDFSSFRAANCQSKTPIRSVSDISVKRSGDLVLIDIAANAFLQHMVRNIAGVLMDVGSEIKPVTWAEELLGIKDRTKGSKTAPPNGLYFIGVSYEPDIGLPTTAWPHFLAAIN
jgi:tRNA pseudouridine38-40 synthase